MSEEMVKEEQAVPVSVLERLLGAELPNVQKDLPTKRFEVPRLSELAGGPVVFVLRGLPYGRVQELQRLAEDVELHILLSGCVEPDLKAPALLGRYNAPTPADTVWPPSVS